MTILEDLQKRDKQNIWHPLTQHKTHPDCLPVERAQGVYLYDVSGKGYIDGISSWYTAVYGHCHPYITERVAAQMRQLDQVVFSGFTHKPAIELSEALLAMLPVNQKKLFFSDNGSTAVEVAIKMAVQYYFNIGDPRDTLIAFEDGFHGDTFGAMSVSGLSVYNGPFESLLLKVRRIPVPDKDNLDQVLAALDVILKTEKVAAFVYEPLVQGAAAMKIHQGVHLEPLLIKCRDNRVLTIADEVMTGFGKTGRNFASQHLKTLPDIICMSKALTAGLLPMAVTSCTQAVYDAFYSEQRHKGLFHGHTYTANPLACTAALAASELLRSSEMQDNIARIDQRNAEFLETMKSHPKIQSVRHLGIIFAMDIKTEAERYGSLRDRIFKFFMDRGLFLRPLGNTIYISPPYVTSDQELSRLYQGMEALLDCDWL